MKAIIFFLESIGMDFYLIIDYLSLLACHLIYFSYIGKEMLQISLFEYQNPVRLF